MVEASRSLSFDMMEIHYIEQVFPIYRIAE